MVAKVQQGVLQDVVELLLGKPPSPIGKSTGTRRYQEVVGGHLVGVGRGVSAFLLAVASRISGGHSRWFGNLVLRQKAQVETTAAGGKGRGNKTAGHIQDFPSPQVEVHRAGVRPVARQFFSLPKGYSDIHMVYTVYHAYIAVSPFQLTHRSSCLSASKTH
jgi:hypothetical protein